MKQVLAIALMDLRRLGFGLASGALILGLIPALASGLGDKISIGVVVGWAFFVVGAVAGGTFGSDFFNGKSSFFFARPLPTSVLILGRFAALLALAATAYVLLMASCWISSSDRSEWTAFVLVREHAEILLSAWAVALFIGLAADAHGRGVRAERGTLAMFMIPVRLILSMAAFLFVFGLFADLVVRAYFNNFTPIRVFALSWVVAAFVASCVAMEGARTERGGISRWQGRIMAAHFALVAVTVAGAWIYILHPGPKAILGVRPFGSWGSNDGRSAYVYAKVNRGDGRTFAPTFILDIGSGQAQRIDADPFQGLWTSADGATLVWSEATPYFFRPLWRRLGGGTSYRAQTASGTVSLLPMPLKLPDFTSVRDLTRIGDSVSWVLPSPDRDIFAIQWDRHLTFTSLSRGEISDIEAPAPNNQGVWEGFNLSGAVFLPSGHLRATQTRLDASGARTVNVVDVDPRSGSARVAASIPTDGPVGVQLDSTASRLLLTSVGQPGRGGNLWLIDLGGVTTSPSPVVLLQGVLAPSPVFLADGRIAASYGGSPGAWDARGLKIFSSTGQLVRDIPLPEGHAPGRGREMFPGVLAISTGFFSEELSLIEIESGAVLRRLQGVFPLSRWARTGAAPGTPAARLLQSSDGKLYELPSPTGELRQLLPLAGR